MMGTLRRPVLALVLTAVTAASACVSSTPPDDGPAPGGYDGFRDPRPVTILGYDGHAMEPFLSRDGRLLFFNNRNHPQDQTDLHVAAFRDSLTFEYLGPLVGANSPALDGVPTMDGAATFYFVTTRSYAETLATIYRGVYADGGVTGVEIVPGISLGRPGMVNFDVEVSADGNTLFFADGRYSSDGRLLAADLALAQRDGEGFVRLTEGAALLAEVNTDALEYAAAISPDGLELLFTRLPEFTATAEPHLYRTTRGAAGAPFGPPRLVSAAQGFVEAATFSPDGNAIYYHRRDGDRFVLYRLTR